MVANNTASVRECNDTTRRQHTAIREVKRNRGTTDDAGEREPSASGKSGWSVAKPTLIPFRMCRDLHFESKRPPRSNCLVHLQSPLSQPSLSTMSLLRVGGAARLRATRLAAPVNARFVSGPSDQVKTSPADAPTTTQHGSSLINKQTPAQALARHQPDYEATIDHGTSCVPLPPTTRCQSVQRKTL